jgi:flagellar protein FlaG
MPVDDIHSTTGLHTRGTPQAYGINRARESADVSEGASESTRLDEVVLSKEGLNKSEAEKALEEMQKYAGWANFNIDFVIDDETESLVVKLVDRDTGEVLRQIPTDEMLSLRSYLQEVLSSVFEHMA